MTISLRLIKVVMLTWSQKGEMMRNTHPTTRRGIVTKRRRAPWLGAFLALVLALASFTAQTAMAADGPFTIDGNVPDAGTTELPDLFGNVKELGPLNSNTTKIGVIHNDGLPTLGETNPNAQVDLRRAWLDTERARTWDWTTLTPVSAEANLPLLTIQGDGSVYASGDQTKHDGEPREQRRHRARVPQAPAGGEEHVI